VLNHAQNCHGIAADSWQKYIARQPELLALLLATAAAAAAAAAIAEIDIACSVCMECRIGLL
jgi:hypothetical protein